MSRWNGPTCPKCITPTGAPIATHHRASEYGPGFNLVCHACGSAWVGTAADVAKAERQERTFRNIEAREERTAAEKSKAAETLRAYERNRREGW